MFPRWLLGAGVLAAWAGAMAWRLERDLIPRWREAAQVSYRTTLQGRFPWEERFRLSIKGRAVGILSSEVLREPDGTITLREKTILDPKALKEGWPVLSVLEALPGLRLDFDDGKPITLTLRLSLSSDYRLQGFVLQGRIGGLPIRGSGEMEAEGMVSVIAFGDMARGIRRRFTLPLDPQKPMILGLSPFGTVPDLPVGRSWDIQVLNPLTLRTETLKAQVAGIERIEIMGQVRPARRVVIRHPLGEAVAWVDADGHILRESMMGFEAERISAGEPVGD